MVFELPDEAKKRINALSVQENEKNSEMLKEIIETTIEDKKLQDAVQLYIENKVNQFEAARIAGVSLRKFIQILNKEQKNMLKMAKDCN